MRLDVFTLGLAFAFLRNMRFFLLWTTSLSLGLASEQGCRNNVQDTYHWQMERLISQLSTFKIDAPTFEQRRAQILEQLNTSEKDCHISQEKEAKESQFKVSRHPASLNAEDNEETSADDEEMVEID